MDLVLLTENFLYVLLDLFFPLETDYISLKFGDDLESNSMAVSDFSGPTFCCWLNCV